MDIFEAINNKDIRLVQQIILLKKIKNINEPYRSNSYTPLHLACSLNHIEITKFLLDNGAKPSLNIFDRSGDTPIHISTSYHWFKMTKLLIQYGTNVNIQRPEDNDTPLHNACRSGPNHFHKELVELLIKNNANIHAINANGLTPIFLIDNYEGIKYLLECGADVNGKLPDTYDSLLHIHCRWREDKKIIKLLLQYGADVNAQNDEGFTPLHFICSKNIINKEIIKLLIKFNANIYAKTNKNKTIMDLVKENNTQKYLDFLLFK